MNEKAEQWATWLQGHLDARGWKQADLVRASGGEIKRDRVSKWLAAKELPSYRLAIIVANTLDAEHADALKASGYERGVPISAEDSEYFSSVAMARHFTRKLQIQAEVIRELRLMDFSESELAEELLRRAEGRASDGDVGGAGESDNLHEADLRSDFDLAASEDDSSVDPTRGES